MTDYGDDDEENERFHSYSLKLQSVKDKWLHGREQWYLNWIGRHPKRKEKGILCDANDFNINKS